MDQDQINAVVAEMLRAEFGQGLKDVYRDLRDRSNAFDASFAMVVACRKARHNNCEWPLQGSYRWWRIFDRLNDLTWWRVAGL
jgi:hypothetical protein